MTVETRWSGVTVTDWLEGAVPKRRRVRVRRGRCSRTARRSSGCSPAAALPGSSSLRGPSSARCSIKLQPLGDGLLVLGYNEPIALYAPGVEWDVFEDGGHDTARAVVDLSAAGGQRAARAAVRLARSSTPIPTRSRTGRRTPSSRRSTGSRSCGYPMSPRRRSCAARSRCAGSVTSRPGRSWRRRRRRCPRSSAACATGTTATAGSATPRCPPASSSTSARSRRRRRSSRWVDGCVGRTGGHPERLHPLYTVEGLELGPEAVIETLPGYAGSRPVRVGNAANRQIQLDVFGPIADLVAAVAEAARIGAATSTGAIVEAMVQAVERRWHEPDHGIWEARLPPRHHVYSKVMCWLTVDRALAGRWQLRGEPRPADWVELRDRIARERARARLERGGRRLLRRLRLPGDGRVVAVDRAVRPARRRRPALPRHGARRSRPSCAAAPSSTATAGTTACPAPRAASTSARRG